MKISLRLNRLNNKFCFECDINNEKEVMIDGSRKNFKE